MNFQQLPQLAIGMQARGPARMHIMVRRFAPALVNVGPGTVFP